jgi:glycosyltransferase involved in cell wall biosynthesis
MAFDGIRFIMPDFWPYNPRMRIGVDGRVLTDRYPGIGRALFAVLPSLAGLGDEVVLIRGPEPESDRFPLTELAALGIEQRTTPCGLRSAGEQLRLFGSVRDLQLDVVLTPYFATALRWPCPRVTMLHDLIPLTVRGGMPSPMMRVAYRWFLRAALDRSQVIVVPSQATADSLFGFGPRYRSRTWVVPHAVDGRFTPASHAEIDDVRSRYGLESPYVMAVAGDRPHKNIGRLTAAWRRIEPADRGDAVLIVAGLSLPSDDPAVRGLGVVPDEDLRLLYTGAEVVAVPSLEEGFGLPAAEAMACNTAVVCSDRPVLRELAGDAAIYFDPYDRTSIGVALTRALGDGDLRRSLSRRGAVRVAEFAPDRVAERLIEPIRGAAGAGS